MNRYILSSMILLLCLTIEARADDSAITLESNMDIAEKRMDAAGYKKTMLSMSTGSTEYQMKMWAVDEGVLSFIYSVADGKIVEISYILQDERPKSTRKTFSLFVTRFDPKTREMKIKLPGPPVIFEATYHQGKGPCIPIEGGGLAMPMVDEFRVTKVMKGQLRPTSINVRFESYQGPRYPKDLKKGERYTLKLTPTVRTTLQLEERDEDRYDFLWVDAWEIEAYPPPKQPKTPAGTMPPSRF